MPTLAAATNRCGAIPVLQNVQIYIAGVDGAGRSAIHWQSLRTFWSEYLHAAGAALQSYAALRTLDSIGESEK